MKKLTHINIIGSLIFILATGNSVNAQDYKFIYGSWEGKFMSDFKAVIELDNDSGKILMFSGEQQIQNDQLNQIKISGEDLAFFIPAKETKFEGRFQKEYTELCGTFIFPDGSRHPITVRKTTADEINSASWQELKDATFKKSELEDDLQILFEQLSENHPQLYRFTSREQMEQLVSRTKSSIDNDMTLIQYFRVIAPVVEAVKCSHTGIRLPSEFRNLLYENVFSFPLELAFQNEKIIIISSFMDGISILTPGNEIVSMNGIEAKDLIDQLKVFIPSEGNNRTTKYNELNQHFRQYLPLLIDTDVYNLEYLNAGIERNIKIEGRQMDIFNEKDQQSSLEFSIHPTSKLGILKIQSFAFQDVNKFIQMSDSIFTAFKTDNIQNLILDLRDNAGGHPIFAAQILSYLTSNPFTYFKENPEIIDFAPLYHPMDPNPIQFKGNLYVIVNGGCLSTTGHLISLLKYHTAARFIGEQPGSTFTCNDASRNIKLPNTGIEVNIPTTTFETLVEGFSLDQPFPLDYEINLKVDVLITGQDAYMEFVKDLLAKNN